MGFNKKTFTAIKREIKNGHSLNLFILKELQHNAKGLKNKPLIKFYSEKRKSVNANYKATLGLIEKLQEEVKADYQENNAIYKRSIKELEIFKEATASDNLLLELKKKDLLQKADELESAYDEIAFRNKELVKQKQIIQEQAEKLKLAHEEILEKNSLLEARTESLQDQADYLHEANEAITQMHRKLMEQKEEIEHKNAELLSLNTEKNNLMGIVAHDLKSPLNQIKGLVSIIKMSSSNMSTEGVECLTMIETSAHRLSGMITKILDTEAIESKKLNLVLEPINFSALLLDVANRYLKDAERKNIVLHNSIISDVIIRADKGYLDQVMDNLISNAIKFSPTHKSIFINLMQDNNHAQCEVKDQGPGLSDEDKAKLFSKYQKLSAKPTGNETSTGLGLSIVKKFVDAMEGKIWCESSLGGGASFFVSLPVIDF